MDGEQVLKYSQNKVRNIHYQFGLFIYVKINEILLLIMHLQQCQSKKLTAILAKSSSYFFLMISYYFCHVSNATMIDFIFFFFFCLRYYAITKPLEYGVKRTPKRMMACVSVVWLGAACISLPPLLILGNTHGEETGQPGTQCLVCQDFGYQIYATLLSFYIPLAVMMFVYYKIFRAARKIVLEERRAQTHLETSHCFLEINKNGSGPESRLAVSCASSPAARAHHRTSTTSTNTTVSIHFSFQFIF